MEEIELLTVHGASHLFGRSDQGVRAAARELRVETELFLSGMGGTGQRQRLLTLESCLRCWNRPRFYEHELADLRRMSFVLEVSETRYRVLHPWPLIRFAGLLDDPREDDDE